MNLLIIVAEIGLVIIFFWLFSGLINNLFKLCLRFSIFNLEEKQIKVLRRKTARFLLIACAVLCILLLGINSFLIYQGQDLQTYTFNLILLLPSGFWRTLGVGIAQSISAVILAALGLKLIKYCLKKASIRAQNLDPSTDDDEIIDAFFNALYQRIKWGVWLATFASFALFLQLPPVIFEYFLIAIRIYLIVALGLLVVKTLVALVDILDSLFFKYSSPDNLLRFYPQLQLLLPFFKQCLGLATYAGIITLAIQQVQLTVNLSDFGLRIIKIIAITFSSRLCFEFVYLLAEEIVFETQKLTELQKSRRLTLMPLFRSLLQYLIYFTAGVFILYTLDINPTPILAGAGIVGIAVGLGAQTLINDIVCGFFILFENYYLVGDYIEAGKAEDKLVEGTVEAIELRTTRIRHPNGQLQIVRNGDIGSITNYSKQYIFAVVEVCVPYTVNLTHVYQIIEEIGQELKTNYPDVLEPTQVDGVERLGESNLLLRTLTKVKPGKHLQIQRLLRQIFMDAWRREGILSVSAEISHS